MNITHDEKKIEELNKNLKIYKDPTQLNGTDYYLIPMQKIEHDRKQYAEHMVQQERERLVGEINSLTPYSIGRDEIGSVISKGSVIRIINQE
jgi:hypothetical protein